jgi:D-aspartate ligase
MKAIKEISFPCILKPSNSSYFRIDFHKKFFICRTKEELLYYYHKGTERNHKFVIQEIIPGDANKMYGFNAYYDHNFIAHGIFTYNRIREWPILAGNGCFIQNKWVPELEEIITPIMKKIKYYGIIDAEFKKDSRDNLYKLIEINPRIWLQNSFPTQCGINIPAMAYMDTIGKDMDEATMTKDVMKWLDCNDDIKAAVIDIKKGTLSFHEWIHSYYGQVNQAIFTREDPFPSIVNFIYFFYVKLLYSYPRKMLRGWSD